MAHSLQALLKAMTDKGASDLHVTAGSPPRLRIDNELVRLQTDPLTPVDTKTLCYSVMNDAQKLRFEEDLEIDFSFGIRGMARFRANVYLQQSCVAGAFRIVPYQIIPLEELGLPPVVIELCDKPRGLVLVTGPTGSGKSTTLYATLNSLNDAGRNIVTIEDPVEYRLAGVNQVQVNTKAGLTFAAALRSILRCDPDIVLIGEIRDTETARIAVESALTGHLVLATLHTNDAPSAITRLTEMGLEPFLVASAVDCVLAQRLARRLCDKCREPYRPTAEVLADTGWNGAEPDGEPPKLYRAVGCAACGKTGYHGRLAVHEVMTVTEEIERLCVERRSSNEIAAVAHAHGMTSLRQDGLGKAVLGETAVEEVVRVVV